MGLFPTTDPHYRAVKAEEAALVEASELIAHAMEACDVSRADLARALNVSRSEITSRLQGNRNMTIRSLAATLHALGGELELGVKMPARSARPELPADLGAYRFWRSAEAREARPWNEYYDGEVLSK